MSAKQRHLVALGSSFAAGPGLAPFVDSLANRSQSNYAHVLAAKLGARLTDLTVSGSTLQHIISEPQIIEHQTYPPQLSLVPGDADVVTITGGGNDLGYIGGMMEDAMRHLMDMPASVSTSATPQDISQRFVTIIDAALKIAPSAKIVLVEYLPVLGSQTHAAVNMSLNAEEVQRHMQVAQRLRDAYRLAAEARPQVLLIPVTDLAADHCLGSPVPWVNGLNHEILQRGGAFHPNQAGMDAVAEFIYAHLSKTA